MIRTFTHTALTRKRSKVRFQSFNQLGSKLRNYQTPSVLSLLQKGKEKDVIIMHNVNDSSFFNNRPNNLPHPFTDESPSSLQGIITAIKSWEV